MPTLNTVGFELVSSRMTLHRPFYSSKYAFLNLNRPHGVKLKKMVQFNFQIINTEYLYKDLITFTNIDMVT